MDKDPFKVYPHRASSVSGSVEVSIRGVLVLLFRVQIHGALITFLIAIQWKCENLLGEKQPKFTETSTPQIGSIGMHCDA